MEKLSAREKKLRVGYYTVLSGVHTQTVCFGVPLLLLLSSSTQLLSLSFLVGPTSLKLVGPFQLCTQFIQHRQPQKLRSYGTAQHTDRKQQKALFSRPPSPSSTTFSLWLLQTNNLRFLFHWWWGISNAQHFVVDVTSKSQVRARQNNVLQTDRHLHE